MKVNDLMAGDLGAKARRVNEIRQKWDQFQGKAMVIPRFVYGRKDIDHSPLKGFCRGFGVLLDFLRDYEDTIGIYTAEGVYYNIVIDTRLECASPQFVIDGKAFYHPIVCCLT